jgi:hypothetical protein
VCVVRPPGCPHPHPPEPGATELFKPLSYELVAEVAGCAVCWLVLGLVLVLVLVLVLGAWCLVMQVLVSRIWWHFACSCF